MTDHWVYRAYDAEGVLLYVGCTSTPKARLKDHRGRAHWWPSATRIEQRGPLSPDEAYAAERAAIDTEHPLFNKMLGTKAPSHAQHVGRDALLNTRIELEDRAAIDSLRAGWSRSEYVRQALADAVKANKRGPKVSGL